MSALPSVLPETVNTAGRGLSHELNRLAQVLHGGNERPALAAWLWSEAAAAADAEELAHRASDIAMSNIQPTYRLSTRHAIAVAYEELPGEAPDPDEAPW